MGAGIRCRADGARFRSRAAVAEHPTNAVARPQPARASVPNAVLSRMVAAVWWTAVPALRVRAAVGPKPISAAPARACQKPVKASAPPADCSPTGAAMCSTAVLAPRRRPVAEERTPRAAAVLPRPAPPKLHNAARSPTVAALRCSAGLANTALVKATSALARRPRAPPKARSAARSPTVAAEASVAEFAPSARARATRALARPPPAQRRARSAARSPTVAAARSAAEPVRMEPARASCVFVRRQPARPRARSAVRSPTAAAVRSTAAPARATRSASRVRTNASRLTAPGSTAAPTMASAGHASPEVGAAEA